DLETRTVIGAEALIRWRQPDGQLVSPVRFVPIAEQCGLIKPIGQWVLHQACRQIRAWHHGGLPRVHVSVNLSPIELRSQTFVDGVRRILDDTGLEPQYLELELTESVLMEYSQTNMETLDALKSMGVKIAIDDFGSGFSNLSYLTRLPI